MSYFTSHDLRQGPTYSESVLWNVLRARRMLGLKFRRQHPIGPFIVDFVCLRIKVVIESDGAVHNDRKAYDRQRDAWLGEKGYTVLRINNDELARDREATLTKLRETLKRFAYAS